MVIRQVLDNDRLDTMRKEYTEEHQVKCPHCGHIIDDNSDLGDADLITYHGSEDGPVEVDCPHCDQPFLVEETVDRTYEVIAPTEKG